MGTILVTAQGIDSRLVTSAAPRSSGITLIKDRTNQSQAQLETTDCPIGNTVA